MVQLSSSSDTVDFGILIGRGRAGSGGGPPKMVFLNFSSNLVFNYFLAIPRTHTN